MFPLSGDLGMHSRYPGGDVLCSQTLDRIQSYCDEIRE